MKKKIKIPVETSKLADFAWCWEFQQEYILLISPISKDDMTHLNHIFESNLLNSRLYPNVLCFVYIQM